MPDRIQELLRQRAAIQAHLDWLDREITRARSTDTEPKAVDETFQPSLVTQPTPDVSTSDPEVILAGYRQDSQNLRTDIRKGCLLYFFGAFLLLTLAVASFYFVNRLIRQQSAPMPHEQRVNPTGEH